MTMDVKYEKRGSDWSHQVSAMGTTWWLQRDQTLPLCEGCGLQDYENPSFKKCSSLVYKDIYNIYTRYLSAVGEIC